MSVSESFKSAVQNLCRELKRIGYPLEVDYAKVTQGEPEAFLPILHHAFVDYSLPLAKHLNEDCKVHLAGKTDSAFITALYTVLRDDFAYRPPITADQFFKRGSFAEKRTVMCIDLLQMVRERHKTLDASAAGSASARQSISATPRLNSSTSKLADSSTSKSNANSNPSSARSTTSTTTKPSNFGPSTSASSRRSFYVAPSTLKKEAIGVPSTASLSRSHSLSTDELKASKAKRAPLVPATASASGDASKDGESDALVSVSNGVRIVVEKHGVNVASRRSIATTSASASASTGFKMPLRAAPRSTAKAAAEKDSQAAPAPAAPAPTESAGDQAPAETDEEASAKKDRRKTMFATYSYSMATKLERARRGNTRLSAISERKSVDAEANAAAADKENEGGDGDGNDKDKAESKSSGVEGERNVRKDKDGNAKARAAGDSEKQQPKAAVTDMNNNKTKRVTVADTKRREQPAVVTIDKTVLETILARLELAETRLRFAERNIDTLLEAARIPQSASTAIAKDVPTMAVGAAGAEQCEAYAEMKGGADSSALLETAAKWAAPVDPNAHANWTPQDADADADVGTVPNVCADKEGTAQPLNDTDVPFVSEVVVGDAAADTTWRRELEAEADTL